MGAELRTMPWVETRDDGKFYPGFVLTGRYVLKRHLGSGATGHVWLASHRELEVDVAVKLLRPDFCDGAGAVGLRREGRAVAQIQHPSVVKVIDYGIEHGQAFLVMEYLHGESLADALENRGAISAMDAVALILPVIRGLGAAHQVGLVHRDIKPENIYLADGPSKTVQPKILDFGISRAFFGSSMSTTMGGPVGTPLYMAPEQCEAKVAADPRADLWSAAVVLFELITGELPFDGETVVGVMHATIKEPHRRPASLYEDEPELAAIVDRCLEKDRVNRYASADELASALVAWLVAKGRRTDATGLSITEALQSEPLALRGTTPKTPDVCPPPIPKLSETLGTRAVAYSVPTLDSARTTLESASVPPKRAVRHQWLWAAAVMAMILSGLGLAASAEDGITETATNSAQAQGVIAGDRTLSAKETTASTTSTGTAAASSRSALANAEATPVETAATKRLFVDRSPAQPSSRPISSAKVETTNRGGYWSGADATQLGF